MPIKKLRVKCRICKLDIIETKYDEHFSICRSNELLQLNNIDLDHPRRCKWCKKIFNYPKLISFRNHQRACRQNPNRIVLARIGSHRPSKYRAINTSKGILEFYAKYKEKLRHYDNYYAQIKSQDDTEMIEILFDEKM